MNNKTILFLVLIFMSCKQDQKTNSDFFKKDCVNTIIKKDDSLGELRNNACKTISLSETILNYTSALDQLDYSLCPKTFAQAFRNHSQAWKEMTQVTDKHKNLRGEMHDLFNIIETSSDSSSFKPLLKNIWDTWEVVETSKNSQ